MELEKKDSFDPFQIFEIRHKPCYILNVIVLRGRHISKGWLKDMLDTPDPYVKISLANSPTGDQKLQPKDEEEEMLDEHDMLDQRTPAQDNTKEPEWNYTLSFLLDLQKTNILTIELLDYNFTEDESLGRDTIDLNTLPIGEKYSHTFKFDVKGSKVQAEVDVDFFLEEDQNPALRYSLCLCDDEKTFLKERRKHVLEGMKEHLGDRAPSATHNAPVVAVLGSGGGFRAMVAFCGAMKALYESGLLDMVTYVSGLSGSAWYLSHLYSNPDWPDCSPGDLFDDLRDSVTKSWTRLLRPNTVLKYMGAINKKKKSGQPVSFTDFFGHLVGELLLTDRKDARLSDQADVVKTGESPMPILACVSVKSDVSAQEFHEWVEFTPFEIGMPKYGIFMKTPMFGSRFFLGRVLKQYPEPPLHYLQGMWGSAFTILLKRLMTEGDEVLKSNLPKASDDERVQLMETLQADLDENKEEEHEEEEEAEEQQVPDARQVKESQSTGDVDELAEATDSLLSVGDAENADGWTSFFRRRSSSQGSRNKSEESRGRSHSTSEGTASKDRSHSISSTRSNSPAPVDVSSENVPQADPLPFIEKVMNIMCAKYAVLGSRKGRAAFIHNYLYGLELNKVYPLSPFAHLCSTEAKNNPFLHIFDPYDTDQKTICMVDAGLSFNSPFPPLLRPQRGVDIFLSFDFSMRAKDDCPPFKELKLAELWARVNNIPFPRIDETVYEREGMKEVYVFKNPEDPTCPVVLHFPLANLSYREFKAPGVRRETKEEKDHGNFSIFEDPSDPYSTFNFKYSKQSFNRLVCLMEYNVLNNSDVIKDVIAECVAQKKDQRKTRLFVFKRALQALSSQATIFSGMMKSFGFNDVEAEGGKQNGVEGELLDGAAVMSPMKRNAIFQNTMVRHVLSRFKQAEPKDSDDEESDDEGTAK